MLAPHITRAADLEVLFACREPPHVERPRRRVFAEEVRPSTADAPDELAQE